MPPPYSFRPPPPNTALNRPAGPLSRRSSFWTSQIPMSEGEVHLGEKREREKREGSGLARRKRRAARNCPRAFLLLPGDARPRAARP